MDYTHFRRHVSSTNFFQFLCNANVININIAEVIKMQFLSQSNPKQGFGPSSISPLLVENRG